MKSKCKISISFLLGILAVGIPCFLIMRMQQRCIRRWKEQADKANALFQLTNQWVNIKQDGKNLEQYFIKNNYNKIAIYGMGCIGLSLAKELKQSEVEVVYGIDRNINNIYSDIKLLALDDVFAFSKVDVVVVTKINEFNEIRDKFIRKVKCPVIAIEDILNEI